MNTTAENTIKARPRPLSPHLQAYRFLMNMALSILHRITGAALAVGFLYLATWLVIAAFYPENYEDFANFASSPLGIFMLAGWSVALNYHFCNGIRHLFWDIGRGFEIKTVMCSGVVVLVATAVLTAAEWLIGLGII